jgi:hypothetical protein
MTVLSYDEALYSLRGIETVHLLLGNGFSIGCDPIFSYGRLYDAAITAGLSARAQHVFDRLGTNNFEGVLRLLDETRWIGEIYGLSEIGIAAIETDSQIVKDTLVQAVANSHLDHAGLVSDEKKSSALKFLSRYKNVFTTNYDLLLYWVVMAGNPHPFADGFRPPEDDADATYLVFTERLGNTPGMYYLHGALHFFLAGGELRKHSWVRTGTRLTDLIRTGLAQGQYPLFVAEGTPERKLDQIQRHGYLWYCLDKLARIKSPLVIYGHALGPSDAHIVNTIVDNPELPEVIVGLHGDPSSVGNKAIIMSCDQMVARRETRRARRRSVVPLSVRYFQTESASVWG